MPAPSLHSPRALWSTLLMLGLLPVAAAAQTPSQTSSLANGPSRDTVARNQEVLRTAPFDDTRDFDFASRGFLGTRADPLIRTADGRVIWDLGAFDFVKDAAPATANPSLWRHSQLIAKHGLFRVTDRIYQVRGFDIANITFVRGDTGWIVIDTLTSIETARAAYDLISEKLGRFPVVAIVYTHSHADHFGGAAGLKEALIKDAPIIAPKGFLNAAISENVLAGPAMVRRAAYQFGGPLDKTATGTLGSAIGAAIPQGTQGLIAPNRDIETNGTELLIDGVRLKFQLTPGTEAPAEMNIAFPDWKVIDLAENANPTLHNILTPRGAVIRDAKGWANGLSEALAESEGYEVLITSHGWPRFGAAEVADFIGKHRDAYAFLHDQTVRLMNQGLTGEEIGARLKLPATLEKEWYNRSYYGSLSFNARAVYQYYMGWYDANPVHLAPLPREDRARRYVDALGGAAKVKALAQVAYDKGDYVWAAELLDQAVFADKNDKAARDLLARTYDQLGWQSENAVWRNIYLTGASELRNGVKTASLTSGGGLVTAMPTTALFDVLATRLDPDKAGKASVRLGFVFPDRNEQVTVSIANGVLTHRSGLAQKLDATLTVKRSDLIAALLGGVPLAPKVMSGEASISGNSTAFLSLVNWLDKPDPTFAIVTP
ncbi:MAG: alkyl sulfatase dimerization domain-containing protein [Asticcacaulis sp.]